MRPAGGESSVGRFILRVLPTVCEKPLGLWLLTCERDPFITSVVFNLLADGTVFAGLVPGSGIKIGEWTGNARKVTIRRCPYMSLFPSFDIEAEWSPTPETFGIEVCRLFGPCPGMRAAVTYYNSNGSLGFTSTNCSNRICTFDESIANPLRCQQFPSFGFQPLGPDVRDQTCHGGCWESWASSWPHNCAPSPACGAAAGECELAADASCPDGLVCSTMTSGFNRPCYCVPGVETACTTSAQCPADQTCTAEVPRNPPWLRDICIHDPNDPR